MKILITTGDFRGYIIPNFYNFLNEVQKLAEVYVWHKSGDIKEIIDEIGIVPDFVFINEFEELLSPKIIGLASLTIPYAVLLYDLHYDLERRKEALGSAGVKYIFALYRDKFYEWYSEFSPQFLWLPHHVDTSVFQDYNLSKEIDSLLMGYMHEWLYPLRSKILAAMMDEPGFVYHEHPGYKKFSEEERAFSYVGEKYAREINRSKMFFTCSSIYEYPLLKYFEVPACKTLLLAPNSQELADLGFIDGVNFVAIDEFDFKDKFQYYLHHEKERIEITEQGYKLIHTRHSTSKRAQDFINMVEEILRIK